MMWSLPRPLLKTNLPRLFTEKVFFIIIHLVYGHVISSIHLPLKNFFSPLTVMKQTIKKSRSEKCLGVSDITRERPNQFDSIDARRLGLTVSSLLQPSIDGPNILQGNIFNSYKTEPVFIVLLESWNNWLGTISGAETKDAIQNTDFTDTKWSNISHKI